MSIKARIARLEEATQPPDSTARPIDVIGRVEAIVRVSTGTYAQSAVPDPPDVTAKISEAVRAVIEVMATQGVAAGVRWAQALKAELLPGFAGVLLRNPASQTEWDAFDRGDLPEPRMFPTEAGWHRGSCGQVTHGGAA